MGRGGDPSWHPFVCRSTGLFCALLLVFVCWIFLFLFFFRFDFFFGLFTCADAGVFLPRHFCGFIDSITIALNAFESVRTSRTLWEPKIEKKSLKEIRPGKRTHCRWTGPNFSLRFRSKISWPCLLWSSNGEEALPSGRSPQSTYKGINVLCTARK